MSEDMQYKFGPSLLQMKMWSTSKVHHQVLKKAGITQRYF